ERGGGAYQAPLPLTLSPLTTGSQSLTGAAGKFCTDKRCTDNLAPCTTDSDCTYLNPPACTVHVKCRDQLTPGAFGQSTAQNIKEMGTPAGDVTGGLAHASTLAAVFCIPSTMNSTVDGVVDLPGPAAAS